MRYPLFVSDFDGTLVRSDGSISKRNIEAIANYRAAGGVFAVCTGRMLVSILPRLKELGLEEGYVVAFQGAQIYDLSRRTLVKDSAFREEEALGVIRFLERAGLHIHIYAEEKLYANRRDGLLEAYEKVCGVKGIVPEGSLSDMVASNHMRIVKILSMQEPSERRRVYDMLRAAFGSRYDVVCSSEWLVEVMPKDQTKAEAVRFLANAYGLPKEKVAAIGDQENDLSMLLAAGGRFAVANAVEELKAVATVVPSFEEDGVAYAIENYAMGEEK